MSKFLDLLRVDSALACAGPKFSLKHQRTCSGSHHQLRRQLQDFPVHSPMDSSKLGVKEVQRDLGAKLFTARSQNPPRLQVKQI